MSWGLIWGALLAMQTNDRELVPPGVGRFGFGRKKMLLCAHKTRAGTKRRADSDYCSRDGLSLCLLGRAFAIDSLLFFFLIFLLEWMPVSLCRC